MALRTTTPTLSIKVTGVDLSQIQTMTITIVQGNTTITKTDESIEIDDDVLIVTLTQAEAARFKDGSANISVQATDYSDNDISDDIKVVWAKRGSRTGSGLGSGDSGSVDLSNYYNKQEVDAKLKALRDYIDSVVSSGGGGGTTEPDEPEGNVYTLKQDLNSVSFVSNVAINETFNVPEEIQRKINKVIIRNLVFKINGRTTASYPFTMYFRMHREKDGVFNTENIAELTMESTETTEVVATLENQEISIDDVTSIDYFQLYKAFKSVAGPTCYYTLSFEINLYYE